MKDCSVYDLLSCIDKIDLIEDITIPAFNINQFSRKMRENGIKCQFRLPEFEYAEYEYPNILIVSKESIIIKSNSNRERFNYKINDTEVIDSINQYINIII